MRTELAVGCGGVLDAKRDWGARGWGRSPLFLSDPVLTSRLLLHWISRTVNSDLEIVSVIRRHCHKVNNF
jgi:hypothetical protein